MIEVPKGEMNWLLKEIQKIKQIKQCQKTNEHKRKQLEYIHKIDHDVKVGVEAKKKAETSKILKMDIVKSTTMNYRHKVQPQNRDGTISRIGDTTEEMDRTVRENVKSQNLLP